MIQSLSKTLNCSGSVTQPNRCARPRIATVAYRLMPAASEKPIVRPSVASASIVPGTLTSYGCLALFQPELLDPRSHDLDQIVAIVERHPGRFHRFADLDVDHDGTDEPTALLHRRPAARDGHRDDGRLRL